MINLDEFNKKQKEKENQKQKELKQKQKEENQNISEYSKSVIFHKTSPNYNRPKAKERTKTVDQEWKNWEKFFASNSAICYIIFLIVMEGFFLYKFITQLDSVAFFSIFIMPFFIIPIVVLWPLGDYFGLTAEYPWNILYFIFLVIRLIITLFFYENIFNLLPDKIKNF